MTPDPPPEGWPNPRPDNRRFFYGVYLLFACFLVVIAVDVVAVLNPWFRDGTPPIVLLLAPLGFLLPLVGLWVFEQGLLWEHTPDRLVFESDRVIGVFEPHAAVRRRTIRKIMPYAEVTKEAPDGLPSFFSFKLPIMAVWAEHLVAELRPTFDTAELRQPPEELPGFAKVLKLNLENYARFQAARAQWRAPSTSASG